MGMKTKTYMALKQELLNHEYSIDGEYSVDRLYNIYCIEEITSIDSLLKSHNEFIAFLRMHKDKFNLNTQAAQVLYDFHIREINRRFLLVCSKYFDSNRKDVENFVTIANRIIGDKNTRVLEVGSGKIPYSSILLARDIKDVSSMDRFEIPLETLKNLNVNGINDYFRTDTDISNVDFIIGQQACSAIEPVVVKCGMTGTPYFMELCGCEAPTVDACSWENYLRKYDKNIKFKYVKSKVYAYDFGTPKPSEDVMMY